MPCTLCKKIASLSDPEMSLEFTTRARSLMGRDGATYKISGSLVAVGHKPRGGWGVTLRVNGQSHAIVAESSREVFVKAQRLAELNNLYVSALNLWFNLNIQWLQRAVEKYQMVRLEDLLAVAIAEDDPPVGTHESPKWSPTAWLTTVWGTLGVYLAGDAYEYASFLSLLEIVEKMLNPAQSPTTGNSAFYQKFALRMFALKNDPVFTQYAARVWLHETVNEISSTPITFEEIAQLNHWKI